MEGAMFQSVVQAVVTGVIGGTVTGAAAWAAIRVEMKYLRRDVDKAIQMGEAAHNRLDQFVIDMLKGNQS